MALSRRVIAKTNRWKRARRAKLAGKKTRTRQNEGQPESSEARKERKTRFLTVSSRGIGRGVAETQHKRIFEKTLRRIRGKKSLREPITRAEFDAMRLHIKAYRNRRPESLYGMLKKLGFELAFEMPGAEVL